MIAAEHTMLVLLAAGRSARFGDVDKLEQPFLGQPLAYHVVTALEGVPFKTRVAVVSGTTLDFTRRGFTVIRNERPDDGMSSSIVLGVKAAQDAGAAAVVIALADMPRVTATHIYRMLDAADSADAVVASSDGVAPCPPVIFGAGRFQTLLALTGDEGARTLIRAGRHVIAPAHELLDIDTPGDLAALCALK